jgi:pimeloyl-ACP methyl ester carboxylesterase
MFNAGVINRLGPHRMNVKLARTLAAQGITSLRFDLAGQGDSRAGTSGIDPLAQAVSDLQAAMDHVERRCGIKRFVLIGICSGAINAYWAAQADARVAGILMFDGFWYRTRWTLPVRHWKRFRATGLRNTCTAVWRRFQARGNQRQSADAAAVGVIAATEGSANPPRADFCRVMNELTKRGVAVMYLYTGTFIDYYSYENQLADEFGREYFFSRMQVEYTPDIDHSLTSLASQSRLIDLLKPWVAGISGRD